MDKLLEKTKELCRIYGIKPARTKGQNFLIAENIYDKIIDAAQLTEDDIVLEVGPGLGFLTAKLAKFAKKVIAVELDDRLAKALQIGLQAQGINNVEVVNADILKVRSEKLEVRSGDYKIVANLPYNITSFFLRKFLSAESKPEMMVLMVQKEVAERITAKLGKMSLLAVSVQFYSEPEIIDIVPSMAFWPEPEVESSIIKLEVRSKNLEVNEKKFFRLVKHGFSSKRKMLKNNLAGGLRISQDEAEKMLIMAGYDPKIRAQDLSVEDWIKLFGYFRENML